MVQVYSKFQPIINHCTELHDWDKDCLAFQAETGIVAVIGSFKMYVAVYMVSVVINNYKTIKLLSDINRFLFLFL